MPCFGVILPAAGQSSRFGGPERPEEKKPFVMLAGKPVWQHSVERFIERSDVVQLIMVISPEDHEFVTERFGQMLDRLNVRLVEGGKERADSIQNAIYYLNDDVDYVAVHDVARPCVTSAAIDAVFRRAIETGAAILADPVTATLKRVSAVGEIEETIPRSGMFAAQTPQVFSRELLCRAYRQRGDFLATDDAQLVERLGEPVGVVPGSMMNLKVTSPDDLLLAARFLEMTD